MFPLLVLKFFPTELKETKVLVFSILLNLPHLPLMKWGGEKKLFSLAQRDPQ